MLARCLPVAGAVAVLCSGAHAQEAAGRSITFEPSVTLLQTFTDNIDLVESGGRSESITEIRPGFRVVSRSGRVQGSIDYSLGALIHARDSNRNSLQNALGAAVTAELIERHVFVDASATVSQQTISAFGTQTGNTGFVNDNRTEVATFSLAPSFRGRLGDWADFKAQGSWSSTNAASTDLGDGSALDASVSLSGAQGRFGWGLNSVVQRSEYAAGDQNTSDATFANLSFAPLTELQLSLRAGFEGEELTTGQRYTSEFWGWGVSWQPGERTALSLQSDQRYFGRSHNFSFQHRMARSIWTYTDSRGLQDGGFGGDILNGNPSRPVSNFDLYFAQFASIEPDPVKREVLVRAFLQATGIDPNAAAGGGFLTTGPTVQRSQNLSVGLVGVRNTITLSGFRNETERVNSSNAAGGDLTNVGRVRQAGFSLGASHRLTPVDSLTLSASRLRTLDEVTQPGSELDAINLFWSGQVGYRTNASAGIRHTAFDSATAPYKESSVFGSISMRF
jgi:uncharacterized protein (PEP-CTERM system associated)